MAVTKADLADMLYEKVGLNKREAKEVVDVFFVEMSLSLAEGKELKLSGFGNFSLRDKNSRPGRNPRTGEGALIEARRVVTFRASNKLKTCVLKDEKG